MVNDNIEDEDEEIILDRRNLLHKVNKPSSSSGPILLGFNQFNVGTYDNSNNLSKEKTIILAVTCTSIGMFTGLLGPTFTFLAESMSTELSSIIWLIAVKAIGFLLGIYFSSYLYTWFNVCCLLGLSCLSISFGVCSLAFITDLTAFYLTSFILGIGLGLSYYGIDALYNRLWTRPSVSTIRWLHLFVALGAILSTLMLLPSTISTDSNILSTTNVTEILRGRREISNDTALSSNLSSVTLKTKAKPRIVVSDSLAKSAYTKRPPDTEVSTSTSLCINSYCCYDQNNRNDTFICQEQNRNQLNDCDNILSLCRTSLNICDIAKNDTWCRIDRICENETKLNCSVQLIDITINATSSTTVSSSTSSTAFMVNSSIITLSSTSITSTTSTITTATEAITTITPPTTTRVPTAHHNKPPTAVSDNDDLSKNFFLLKIHSFFQSITSIHLLYLFLTFSFFLLGIFYSILAMCGERVNSSSVTNLNPLSLLILKPHQIVNYPNTQTSLFSDQSSLKFVILVILFYFILSGIESSCTYLTYSLGSNFNLSKTKCLLLQLCYFSGRVIDILINYIWFSLNKYLKKQSNLISIKVLILFRLILLFIICFSNIYHQIVYFLFFSIGFFLASLSSLILYWIERDLCLNEKLLRMILFTIIISEVIFPVFVFNKIEYFLQFYLFISLFLLISVFLFMFYISKKWQTNRLYRLLPTALDLDDMESPENSDNERMKDTKLH